jgi:hypothetical protein
MPNKARPRALHTLVRDARHEAVPTATAEATVVESDTNRRWPRGIGQADAPTERAEGRHPFFQRGSLLSRWLDLCCAVCAFSRAATPAPAERLHRPTREPPSIQPFQPLAMSELANAIRP